MTVSITWHGHSNFAIRTPGCSLLVDPFFTGNPKAVTGWQAVSAPDAVLVTHLHGDHAGDAVDICKATGAMLGAVVGAAETLKDAGVPADQIINGIGFNIGGTVTVRGARITMTEAFHTTEGGAPTGFIISLPEGFTVYHSGDTGIFANMSIWGDLYDIDVALLPIGGVFTMDARQAALAARMLKAKAVIPMHWGTFPVLAQDTREFQEHLAITAPTSRFVELAPGQTVTF